MDRAKIEAMRKIVEVIGKHIYKAKGPYSMGLRFGDNLFVALNRCYIFNDAGEFIAHTNVEILDGYLYGAAHEIREHAERGGDR